MDKVEVQGNFYDLLGVEPGASSETIRASYRRLMQQAGNHPDLGGDAKTAAFINKAYAVLKDPGQRSEYDARLDILRRVSAGFGEEPKARPVDASIECLFCANPHDYARRDTPEVECEHCGSPLQAVEDVRIETADKRAVRRVNKKLDLTFFTHWQQPKGIAARTEDISPQGLRMVTRANVSSGQRIRLISHIVEAVGDVTYCAPRHTHWRSENIVGVAFRTLRFVRSVGGFVSRRA